MSWRKDNSTIVLVVLSFSLVLMLLLRQIGRLEVVQDTFVGLVAPVQYSLSRLLGSLGSKIQVLAHLQRLEAQQKSMEEAINQVVLRTAELEEAKIELELLREQLGFKRANPEYQTLAAEVIGQDPTNLVRFLIIDRGASDGVKRGMPVISSRGLVGRVAEVGSEWAKVLLLTDPSSSVNAMIQRSRATGTVHGLTGRKLVMRYIAQSESLEVDDIVMTSGLGGNFPKHLVIGQVTSIRRSDVEMFQEAELRSAVDFNRLETVMVILNFTPIELGPEVQ